MIELKALAKINLSLKVKKKKIFDRLHKIYSEFVVVDDLFDIIKISEITKGNDLITANIVLFENNPIKILLEILRKHKIIKKSYKIEVIKKIPTFSGLGGFSSICVTIAKHFLKNIDEFYTKKIKKEICKKIGSDCYFFFAGYRRAIVSEYGNKVIKVDGNLEVSKNNLLFANISCETKDVFAIYRKKRLWKNNNEINMLTPAILFLYPELINVYNPNKYFFTGSGSTMVNKNILQK